MQVLSTIAAMRAARRQVGTLGLVPTMGYLHRGHLALVERALAENGTAAASIFVNPTQFAPNEDLGRYPRDLDRDLHLLEQTGTSLAFVPDAGEIYPPGFDTRIEPGAVAEPLEGAVRPGHFAGVATVVTKLFNIVQPDRAYFGQKDAQQVAVIRQLARDLDIPVRIVVADTVRDPDGLALSSRNSYLTTEQRARAPVLHQALLAAQALFQAGEQDANPLREAVRVQLAPDAELLVDYVSVADPDTLRELGRIDGRALLSLAVRLGRTRLIDNLVLAVLDRTGTAAGPDRGHATDPAA